MKNIAVIDLGTNTFNLLIANQAGEFVYKEKTQVKLGKDGISKGIIAAEAFQRALDAMMCFKKSIEAFGTSKIIAVGTSALRNAANARELITKISTATGIDVQVISGEKEAEYIYEGVKRAVPIGKRPSLVVDIGGGSVEFIIGDESGIFWKGSFEIGAQRLVDLFHHTEPMEKQAIKALFAFLKEQLKPVAENIKKYVPKILIGSSGTFDTLAEIDIQKRGLQIQYKDKKEYEMSIEEYAALYTQIIEKTREERMAIPGMIEMRVDMIVVACCLIQFMIQEFDLQKICISAFSLKEGVLFQENVSPLN